MSRIVSIGLRLEGAQRVASDMQSVAQQTRDAAQAAQQAQERYQQLGRQLAQVGQYAIAQPAGSEQEYAAKALAQRLQRQAAQAQQQAIGYQLGILNAPPGGAIGGGLPPMAAAAPDSSSGGFRDVMRQYGLGRIAMPLFLAHAAGSEVEGFGKGLLDLAKQENAAADATDHLVRRMADSIPILGGLARGIGDIVQAAGGVPSIVAANERFAAIQGRATALRTGAFSLGVGGLTRMGAARAEADEATLSAAGAAYYAAGLTPDVLASFRPEVRPGEATAQTGALRQRRLRAQAEALAAAGTAGGEFVSFQQLRGRLRTGDRAAEIAQAQVAADAAKKSFDQLQHQFQNTPGAVQSFFQGGGLFAGAVGAGFGINAIKARQGLEASLETARGNLEVAQRNLQALREQQGTAFDALEGGRGRLTRAQAAAARAQGRFERADLEAGVGNDLAVMTDLRGRHEQAALGVRSNADAEVLLRLARVGMANPQALTAEQQARLESDPMLGPQFRERKREAVAQFPAFQQIEKEFGGGRVLGDLEAKTHDLADEYEKRLAGIMAKEREATATAFDSAADQLGDIIQDAITNAVEKLRVRLSEDATKRRGAEG